MAFGSAEVIGAVGGIGPALAMRGPSASNQLRFVNVFLPI